MCFLHKRKRESDKIPDKCVSENNEQGKEAAAKHNVHVSNFLNDLAAQFVYPNSYTKYYIHTQRQQTCFIFRHTHLGSHHLKISSLM